MIARDKTNRRCGGFTLTETLIALGVVGILLALFLTVFVPARSMVRDALICQEADRVASTLKAELTTLRAGESAPPDAKTSTIGQYISSFDKAFLLMSCSRTPNTALIIFSYRADTDAQASSRGGYYPAMQSNSKKKKGGKKVSGADTFRLGQMVTVVCPLNKLDSRLKEALRYSQGPVFMVRMSELRENADGSYSVSNSPGTIARANKPEKFVSSEKEDKNAWGGVLMTRADFFVLPTPDPARYKHKTWKQMGRPTFSVNMSFHR